MAEDTGPVYDEYESITVGATAEALDSAVYGNRQFAFITVEGQAIRFRVDGTAPTATEGHEVIPGGQVRLKNAQEVAAFRAIRRDSIDATIRVSYGW